MYPIEDMAQAMIRDRQEEVRRFRAHVQEPPRTGDSLRARLARALLRLALRLDAGVNGGMASALTLSGRPKSSRV